MANLDVEIDEKTKWDIIDEVLYLEQENIKTEQRKDADMIREIVKIIKTILCTSFLLSSSEALSAAPCLKSRKAYIVSRPSKAPWGAF